MPSRWLWNFKLAQDRFQLLCCIHAPGVRSVCRLLLTQLFRVNFPAEHRAAAEWSSSGHHWLRCVLVDEIRLVCIVKVGDTWDGPSFRPPSLLHSTTSISQEQFVRNKSNAHMRSLPGSRIWFEEMFFWWLQTSLLSLFLVQMGYNFNMLMSELAGVNWL